MQCAGGMAMHHPIYLLRARELCDQFGVHLIADEIAVGFGRTGTLFASEQAGITPDFMCLSKGLTGGYLPLSVVMTTDAIYRAFYHDEVARGFLHSHSYTGNPLACRAALATLDIFAQDDVIASNRIKAAQFTQAMQPLQDHPRVRHFRHLGMIWAFDVADAGPNFGQEFYQAALQRGLILRPLGNTVYFMPPYVIEMEEMGQLIQGTLACLDAA